MLTDSMLYVTIYCDPPGGGAPQRECVKNYPVAEILGLTLAQALAEARKVCPFEECDLQ